MNPDWIVPEWPAPDSVRAFCTTRAGGYSQGPWRGLNLGMNCNDEPGIVKRNREALRAFLPSEPAWLRQEHGIDVYCHPGLGHPGFGPPGSRPADSHEAGGELPLPVADAQIASQPGQVCVVLTADCLPVLFCDRSGGRVAAAHAGWRGLVAGILERTVEAMGGSPRDLLAWLGPAIGPRSYEVGDEVREKFLYADEAAHTGFVRRGERWLLDLYALARQRLARAGVHSVYGGTHCTFEEPERFYSFRRDGVTGRMASIVWLEGSR